MKKGPRIVKADIEAAKPAVARATGPKSDAPDFIRDRFEMRTPLGLFKKNPDETKGDLWLSSAFEIVAETEDEDETAGLCLAWHDRNGRQRREVFARDLFAGECGELRARLARGGLTLNANRDARQAFAEFLNVISSPKRARCVARTGWHQVGAATVFVLPDGTIGRSPELVLLQAASREKSLFNQAGTLAEWRDTIGQRCIGNSRLVLTVSTSFAAALLYLVGEDGGGIHLVGNSRIGKTTATLVASSVCGGDPAGGGAKGFQRTWRSTTNATESIAALHSDAGLVLDELGQADPREVGPTAYMLASGVAKARADRGGGLRAPLRFRNLFLSTGELPLGEKIAEAGLKVRAGQEVRLVDVPADAGASLGVFENLHDAVSPAEFAQALREAVARFYGTPFRAFLQHIIGRLAREPDFAEALRAQLDAIAAAWLKPFGSDGGQVRSVARRFALIALAGRLATDALITGWAADEAETAAHACFRAWLSERGTTGAREELDAVLQLRKFISEHGSARFENWAEPRQDDAAQMDVDTGPPHERFRTQQRAGWRRWIDGCWTYYLTPDAMRTALAGLDFKASLKVLVAAGFIEPGSGGKTQQNPRVPTVGRQRLYCVKASIISARAGDGDAAEDDDAGA